MKEKESLALAVEQVNHNHFAFRIVNNFRFIQDFRLFLIFVDSFYSPISFARDCLLVRTRKRGLCVECYFLNVNSKG